MQPEPGASDNAQQSQTVAWLDEERRRDKSDLQKLQGALEQTLSRYREAIGRLELAEAELRQVKIQVGRLGHSEDGVREVREALMVLQEWQEEHQRSATRQEQTQMLAVQRDQRGAFEIQTKLTELARDTESLKARSATFFEEIRRDQGNLLPVQHRLDEIEKRLQAVYGRLDLSDESHRHRDVRTVELAQLVDRLAAEQGRFTDWQRLSEVRWSRQLADWQSQMEEWRRESEDGVREVQGVAKSVPSLKDDLAELRRALDGDRERAGERAGAFAEFAAQRAVDRQSLVEAEKRVGLLSTRMDNLSAQMTMLLDKADRLLDQQLGLEGRLRAEQERSEGILLAIARLEERDSALNRRLDDLMKENAARDRSQGARTDDLDRNLADLARRIDMRLTELERIEEEHKQREIAELEQQIREMQERAKQAKS